METEFTPLASLGGGALIGLGAVMLMGGLGRIMGATGILAGIVFPESGADLRWRLAAFAGMVMGPALAFLILGKWPALDVPVPSMAIVAGGLLVGLGASYGSGCTSGHGVCGLSRLSGRSMAAVATFMTTAAITVFLTRHVFGG